MSAVDVDLVSGEEGTYEDNAEEDQGFDGEEETPIDIDDRDSKPSATIQGVSNKIKVEGTLGEGQRWKFKPRVKSSTEASRPEWTTENEAYSNQRDDDEREVNELKARQKKRNDDIWKRKQQEVKDNPDERGNISRRQREDWAGIDRGPGNSKRTPAIKIEGAVTTKSTFEKKYNKTTITKPRNRGAVVGNGETLNLEEDPAKKVSKWWLDLGIEQVCI
jgi:hypothetical protein